MGTPRHRLKAFGLIEVLVGLVIGCIALLVVHRVLAMSESYRETTIGGGDAQSAAVLTSLLVAQELSNAGSGISSSAILERCPADVPYPALATTLFVRPIPVLIRDGGADTRSDSIELFYSTSSTLATPVRLRFSAGPAEDYRVRSPLGFRPNDLLVVVDEVLGRCEIARATAVSPMDAEGIVLVAHTATASAYPADAWLVNLGPDPNVVSRAAARRVRYDASDGLPCASGCSLRVTDLLDTGAAPNPIASNIVLFKAQYGIDTDNDGFADSWLPATGSWSEASVRAMSDSACGFGAPCGKHVKAVRIALIVRSSPLERSRDVEGHRWSPQLERDFTTTIFRCPSGLPCSGEMTVTLPRSAQYRYRVVEQVVPLRSRIWNAS